MISISKVFFVFFFNEIINRTINEMSASKIKILIIGSALNKPVISKSP